MVQHHHHHHRKSHEEEGDHCLNPKPRFSVLRLLFFVFLIFSFLIFISRFSILKIPSAFLPSNGFFCSPSSPLCCDRSSFRTDICFLAGDIRTRSSASSLLIISNSSSALTERIKPYTRKWESSTMATINELHLNLLPANITATVPKCDALYEVPAVVFSTGGYTGNVYHEFNDGLIPLYLTSRRFNRRVIFLILEYHNWWISKYADVISMLSDFPPIDFYTDVRTHCFPYAIVGLQIHGDLSIDGERTAGRETMADFHQILDKAYRPRIQSIMQNQGDMETEQRPKLTVLCRNDSRAIENESELAALADELGFRVELLRPDRTTEMAKIYMALNSSDAMIGVHGAAMTHLLFMRPGTVLIQIVPLGLNWPAEEYYGKPAAMARLRYESYRILARESSLSRNYEVDDPVLRDPDSVNARGWETTKKIYLDGQSVKLDLQRFRKRLVRAHSYLVSGEMAGNRRNLS